MRRNAAILALSLWASGCTPGGEGWRCDSAEECKDKMECKTFNNGGHYCVKPGTSSIGSRSTYGWPGVIVFWGGAGLGTLFAIWYAVEALRG